MISEMMQLIYEVKMNLLPPGGGWATVKGNPYAVRGLRVPESIRNQGVHHLDIYYAYDEEFPWKYDRMIVQGFLSQLEYHDTLTDAADYIYEVCENNGISAGMQLTWVTLHTPSSQHIRMYSGELRAFSQDMIQDLLGQDWLEIRSFDKKHNNPVWDETTRDLVGSLMVDGLTLNEAQDMLIKAGEKFEKKVELPAYFYRPLGEYYDTFCEEPEYQLHMKGAK